MSEKIKPVECPVIVPNMASVKEITEAVGAVYSDDIWWMQIKKGFWWPLDFTSAIDIGRKPPRMKYLGYQYINYSSKSNSYIRHMFIGNLENYDMQFLKSSARRNTRASLRSLEFKIVVNFDKKEAEQAANCWNDLVERTKWRKKKWISALFQTIGKIC